MAFIDDVLSGKYVTRKEEELKRKQEVNSYSNDNTAKQRSNLILNNQNKNTVLSQSGNTIGNRNIIDTKAIAKSQNKDLLDGASNIINPNSWINKAISNGKTDNKKQGKQIANNNILTMIKNANIAKENQRLKGEKQSNSNNIILPMLDNKTDTKANLWNKRVDINGKEINNLTTGQQFEKSRRVLPIFAENVGIGASRVLPSIANYGNAIGQLAYEGAVSKGLVDYNSDNIVYKRQEQLDKEENKKSNKIEKNINEILPYDNASKKLATVAPSIGENLVSMGVSSVSPVLGSASFMLSASGNYLNDAKARGMSTDKAFGYATAMGIAEGGSEALISANMLSSAKRLVTGTGISKKVLSSMGMNVGENFFQEAIMEPLQEATAQAIGGKDTANWDNIWGRMLESGLDGVLSALLLQGASVGIASSVSVMDKLNNKIVPTTQEYMKALVDIQNSGKVNTKDVIDGAVISTIDDISKNNISNIEQQQLNTNNNAQIQQVTPMQNKVAQNGLSENIEIKEEVNGSNGEETYITKTANINKKEIGKIEYSVYKGKPHIKMIEVIPEYRRQGIATRLLQKLQDEYKNIEIDFGMTTEDGTKLLNNITYKVPNVEIQEKKNRINEIEKILNEYEIKFENETLTEVEGDNWNRLEDEKRKLIDEIWNKNEFTTFVKNNELANNQETLYNNTESESGINGQFNTTTQTRDMARNISQSRLVEEQKKFEQQRYQEWEQSIKPKQESNLTYEERQVKQKIEKLTGKKIVFIEEDNGNGYTAGASFNNSDTLYINTEKSKQFGLQWTALHETMESNIRFANKENQDIIISTIDDIINDETFKIQKEEFWKNQEGKIPSDTAIAKELICDRYAELNGAKLDYKNVLSNELKDRIDMSIEYFNQELEKTSSFNLSMQNEQNNTQNINPTRHEVIQKNRDIAKENIANISEWKDKSSGLKYQLETMERNMYDIIKNKEEAKKIIDTYFEPIHSSEAQKQKFINKYNNIIKEFKLNKYESEAVQVLGEKKYNPDFKIEEVDKKTNMTILDKVNKNIKEGKVDKVKVDKAIETFRKIYDELFELENKALRENGYKEKKYRKGYFPHFIDYIPKTKTEKVLNNLGFKIDKRPLPTDIAGITEQFVPGKTWNKSALERKTNKTDYNALKGFDTYISQASDNIFHTENIQRLRGLENEIRYQYSDKGVQERIDNILNDEVLDMEEKQIAIDNIFEQVENPLPNLVTELRRYTNALANKKSEADRSIENMLGRPVYSTVNAIENRFGANAVGLNIGSAITNFIPITQAYSQVSTKNMGRAIIDTIKSYNKNDGFVDNSDFLTSRLNQAEKLYKTPLEKISDKTSFLFNAIDEVTSNIVVRGKYLENIQNGMTEIEAMKDADQFARNVIADRSKGALPTKFEEKNPVTKMFTQFQLEVNNQYRYIFKDIPRDLKEKGLSAIALAFFKMFIAAFIYNKASEEITGRKAAFSPIDLAVSTYENFTDKDKTTYNKIASTAKEYAEQAPFVGGLLGGGRVPVNGAIPDISSVTKATVSLATGEMDSKKALSTLGKEMSKPLYYLLPPFGGGQIKKSVEGISTVAKGGSYGIDNKGQEILQFPVENPTAKDYIKAGIFGKYALPMAREYENREYKSLNAKQTTTYKDTKLPYKGYLEYIEAKLKNNEEKIKFLNSKDWNESQKWGIYTNDIFSSTERKSGGSQLEDAKYAISNGTSKADYIKMYNETSSRKMDMPTKQENIDLKKQGISLKNYIDYSIKVHDKTTIQKANGTLKYNQQLKNKDKIDILLNLNTTDKEKEAIYKESINNEDKKIQLVDKLGLPLNQYLKYKQQEFKNDKDEDGETISGTKKQRVYDYLNSISNKELPIIYKKMICKLENINDYNSDITNYVIKNTKASDKKELLEILGFKVDKEGYIKNTTILPITKNVK